ncbi:MAG: hypothetical protein MZV63_31250 [Marinilabiliales bacterium]|nr:hypothetical protein [Marinilabiliales bacterium]
MKGSVVDSITVAMPVASIRFAEKVKRFLLILHDHGFYNLIIHRRLCLIAVLFCIHGDIKCIICREGIRVPLSPTAIPLSYRSVNVNAAFIAVGFVHHFHAADNVFEPETRSAPNLIRRLPYGLCHYHGQQIHYHLSLYLPLFQ